MTWAPHFDLKLKSATKAFYALRGAGLLGPVWLTARVVEATLWPIIDSGRAATFALATVTATAMRKLLTFFMKVAKTVLGVSKRACSDAVLAELGWLTDALRADLAFLQHLRRTAALPPVTLSKRLLEGALQAQPGARPTFLVRAEKIANAVGLDLDEALAHGAKQRLKRHFTIYAHKRWRARAEQQPAMLPYLSLKAWGMQPYLTIPPFRGRVLLTKVRINDLRLEETECHLCGPSVSLVKETRAHFLFACPLREYDEIRMQYSPLLPCIMDTAGDKLLRLVFPRDLSKKAVTVGNFLTDMWNARCVGLAKAGIQPTPWRS
jgi:hypothetical protein